MNILGIILLGAAVFSAVYLTVTLIRDIRVRIKNKKDKSNEKEK